MCGVWRRMSSIGVASSRRSAMNMRGMTGKWKAMWHSSPSPKYSTTSAGHWLASASSTRSGYSSSTVARTLLEELVRLGEVLAVRALALEEVGHGVEAEAVEAEVEPEAQRVEHRLLDLGVVVVEVGLVAEEAVPVVRAGLLVPRPVRRLGVGEDDPRLFVLLVRVRPDVPVALGVVRARARLLEPRVVARRVVHDEVGDDAQPALVRGLDELADVLDRPVVGMDVVVVGDVVAAVAQRRLVHRQQPDAVDAEPLQVVELLDQPAEVAGRRRRCRRRTRAGGSRRRPRS